MLVRHLPCLIERSRNRAGSCGVDPIDFWRQRLLEIRSVKEDVLEQVVDDYLNFRGYLTTHNVRFRPATSAPGYQAQQDSVHSDVDVVGYHPLKQGTDRVIVVSCKAWQGGFRADAKLAELRGEKKNPKRATWRLFRELWNPKWSTAFVDAIEALTGTRRFSYRIAVTRLVGNGDAWKDEPQIQKNLPGCTFGFLTLEEMWGTMLTELTTTPAPSEIGRLAQLLIAAELTAPSSSDVDPKLKLELPPTAEPG
jgi:hypothetical protein